MKQDQENYIPADDGGGPASQALGSTTWPRCVLKLPGGPLRNVFGILMICVLVFLVYRPLLPGVFLMDDHRLVAEDNPLVDGEFTLWNIWFQTDFILSNIVFWVQWLAWGNHPGGYHAVNMALHAASAILLWRLLLRLKIPGAWVAGAIFAVHPVAVGSVARIAELKNTLSLPFFLLSFWAYLRYEDEASGPEERGESRHREAGAGWYAIALLAFVLALLGKTSTVMLSPVLLFCVLWRRGKITPQDEWRLFPFFLLSLVFGVMSTWFQKYQALAGQVLPHQSMGERLAVAGKTVWFYLGKVLWPFNLNAFYPVWKVDAAAPAAYLSGLILILGFIIGWRFRHGWGRHFLFGLGCFVVCLFPVLGFFDAQYLTWFQVSDHLQYLPMLAPLALAVAGLHRWLGAKNFRFAALALVLGGSVLACQRARVFSHEESLMRDCLVKNPAAWGAQNSLGTILAARNDLAGAITNFETALQYQPDDAAANLNLGHALALQRNFEAAEPHFLQAIKRTPIDPEIRRQYAHVLELQGRNPEALKELQTALALNPNLQARLNYAALLFKTGDFHQTEVQLRLVVLARPDLPDALNNLAWLLATSPEDSLRDGAEAVRCAEKACQLTGYKQPGLVGTLAAAYAEAGRFPEAVKTCQLTVNLADAAGQPGFSAANSQLLKLYQMGMPYHAGPPGS